MPFVRCPVCRKRLHLNLADPAQFEQKHKLLPDGCFEKTCVSCLPMKNYLDPNANRIVKESSTDAGGNLADMETAKKPK